MRWWSLQQTLAVVCALVGCGADKANPIMPSSGTSWVIGASVIDASSDGANRDESSDRVLADLITDARNCAAYAFASVDNPVGACGIGNACHPLPGFAKIGYCQQA